MNDPNNAYIWKLSDGSVILGQILKLIPGIQSQKAVHQALNGAIYIQQLGEGVRRASITLFVDSQDALMKVDRCNSDGKFLAAYYRGATYFGIIEDEQIEWEEQQPGNCYTGVINYQISQIIKDDQS